MKTGFPSEILRPDQNAICFFCAAFGGKPDVKFIKEAGLTKVCLNDHDREKMNAIDFPEALKINTDAFLAMKMFAGKTNYAVVVSDHWSGQDQMIHETYLKYLKKIATEWLSIVMGLNGFASSSFLIISALVILFISFSGRRGISLRVAISHKLRKKSSLPAP